ncbi:MAG TPA: phosphotransferase [Pseudomonadales bacterium]|jgi:aminoglycoside/choline kinase family phosphotransferase
MTNDELAVPETPADVTPAWLTRALGQRWPGIEVRSVVGEPLGEGIGQISLLQRLTLEHAGAAEAPRHMVLKMHTTHADMLGVAVRFRMYEREANFYNRFADRVPLRTPEVYHAATEGLERCVMLMEDMSSWHSPDQLAGPTLEEAELAVDSLATLTAAFWNSPELSDHASWLPDFNVGYMSDTGNDYRQCLPEFLRRYETKLPPGSADAARTIADRYDDLTRILSTGPQVLTHYDYRLENMFFRNDAAEAFCALDWQLVMRARPGWDIAYFMGTNLPVSFLDEHGEALRDRYYQQLQSNGVQGYARADLEADLAIGTMAMTGIPIIGGANADLSNPRNEALFTEVGSRAFGAVIGNDCLAYLP